MKVIAKMAKAMARFIVVMISMALVMAYSPVITVADDDGISSSHGEMHDGGDGHEEHHEEHHEEEHHEEEHHEEEHHEEPSHEESHEEEHHEEPSHEEHHEEEHHEEPAPSNPEPSPVPSNDPAPSPVVTVDPAPSANPTNPTDTDPTSPTSGGGHSDSGSEVTVYVPNPVTGEATPVTYSVPAITATPVVAAAPVAVEAPVVEQPKKAKKAKVVEEEEKTAIIPYEPPYVTIEEEPVEEEVVVVNEEPEEEGVGLNIAGLLGVLGFILLFAFLMLRNKKYLVVLYSMEVEEDADGNAVHKVVRETLKKSNDFKSVCRFANEYLDTDADVRIQIINTERKDDNGENITYVRFSETLEEGSYFCDDEEREVMRRIMKFDAYADENGYWLVPDESMEMDMAA